MTRSEMIWALGAFAGAVLVACLALYRRLRNDDARAKAGLFFRSALVAAFGLSWAYAVPARTRKNDRTPM